MKKHRKELSAAHSVKCTLSSGQDGVWGVKWSCQTKVAELDNAGREERVRAVVEKVWKCQSVTSDHRQH